ncbi:hypothetical protein DACRYDRAFT_112495 [Dacryopinax primogenitus]|uniref:Uncharacterized protein n=1 Tax=Dacryopinax primogenitus (strain DJM 731) TaxID=1858805 RepID=M5FP08_DACPD|nr:uncharacterized protein DACRYDRAFT_112495 [Dacryopinax primogenitus]EJT96688.1 hypothetical protein DACRYDRAFT_112495 [Dacryopinax primogenitus]
MTTTPPFPFSPTPPPSTDLPDPPSLLLHPITPISPHRTSPSSPQGPTPTNPPPPALSQRPMTPREPTSTPSSSSSSISSPLTIPPVSTLTTLRPLGGRRRSSLRPGFWIPQGSLLRNESKDPSLPGSGAQTPMSADSLKIRDPAAMSVSSDSRAGSDWGGDGGDQDQDQDQEDVFGFGERETEGMSLDEQETLRAAGREERRKLEEIFGHPREGEGEPMSPDISSSSHPRLPYLARVTRLLTLETSPMPEIESEAALQRLMSSASLPPTPLSSVFRKSHSGVHNRFPESAVLEESESSESSDEEEMEMAKAAVVDELGLGLGLGLGVGANATGGSGTSASATSSTSLPLPAISTGTGTGAIPIPSAEEDFPDDISMSEGSIWGMRASPILERAMWARSGGMDLDVPLQNLPSPYRLTPPPYTRKRKRSPSPSLSTQSQPPTQNQTQNQQQKETQTQPIPIKRPRLSHLSTPTNTPLTPHSLLPPFLPSSPTTTTTTTAAAAAANNNSNSATNSTTGSTTSTPGPLRPLALNGVGAVANSSPRWARAGLGGGLGLGLGLGLGGRGKELGEKDRERERELEAGEGVRRLSLHE